MVPVVHILSLIVFSKLLRAFLYIIFRRGFPLGRQPCRPIWCSVQRMVWALTGWPPHPFNLCSNAGSTHTSISQSQPLDMTLSTCTQLLWSTMARLVLSGTGPVKPLYGLGHRAAAQFQKQYIIIYYCFYLGQLSQGNSLTRQWFFHWQAPYPYGVCFGSHYANEITFIRHMLADTCVWLVVPAFTIWSWGHRSSALTSAGLGSKHSSPFCA